jgi:molecular chaperone GrpE
MVDKRGQKATRIPVHFVDEKTTTGIAGGENERDAQTHSDQDDLSPEEIGRESSYEGETEVQRRIDRGEEEDSKGGQERADESDTAGGPPRDELPERREDRDQVGSDSHASTRKSTQSENEESAQQATGVSAEATGPMLAELIATRAELRRVETQRDEFREALARRQADFENYRKRVDRDRADNYHRMVGDVVSKLLPVHDNLRRALEAEASLQETQSKEFRHFLNGVELIYKQLGGVLEGLGLQPVLALGQRFDPHIHEAVVTEQTEEYEPDTVIQEIAPGYRLGDKLLRPAMVKVATR